MFKPTEAQLNDLNGFSPDEYVKTRGNRAERRRWAKIKRDRARKRKSRNHYYE